MSDEEIKNIVNQALIDEFELESADMLPEADIHKDLGLDSLDIVDMVIVLEKAFHFKLENREKLATIVTLGDIYVFISSLRDAGTIRA
jgi:acyl carrier protein